MARAKLEWQYADSARPCRKLEPDGECCLARQPAKLERGYAHCVGGSDLHNLGFFALEVIVDLFNGLVGEFLDINFQVVQSVFGQRA